VVRFVDRCLLDAWAAGASDLHFEMQRAGMDVKMRLDGVLVRLNAIEDPETAAQVINRVKVLAQLDISETRIPQDGRFRCAISGRGLDFRVSIMPSVFGEDAVVRLLDKAQLRKSEQGIALADLGFAEDALAAIRQLSSEPHGMLLVTGPTGSGKTTTLYALLSEIRSGEEKVVTIEDPVEYELSGVLQIPVNEKKGLTFAKGLRSILRHDPDRILVGEIRDEETASIAVQAALTGHLVYSTVHANSVYDLVGRFVHMGVDLYGFASAINGVVSQRLLRRVCQACAVEAPVELVEADLRSLERVSRQPLKFRRGGGCVLCRGTGYRGRVAVADVLPFDDRLRELITERAAVRAMREYVASLQVVTLRQRALSMLAGGQTTVEEVRRVVGSAD
jgi:general secretion pathway protein E